MRNEEIEELRDSGIQGLRSTSKELIAKVDGYQLGLQHGKTMAEVDAYYEGLLKEIKELEEMLNERTPVESITLSPASRGIPRGKGGQ